MSPSSTSNPSKRHRFPAEIISHCVGLYFHFCPSYRDVEELMATRGLTLIYEAVQYGVRNSGKRMPISSNGGVLDPTQDATPDGPYGEQA